MPPQPLLQSLSTSHYAAIGMVAANWSAFERLVESLLWTLADADDQPAICLTAQIPSMTRRFDALLALTRLRGGDEQLATRINRFAEASHALNDKRNRVVHDTWHWNFPMQQALRLEMSANKKLVYGFVAMSEDEIAEIGDKIADHIEEFDGLATAILSGVSPWQRRPR
jgi:hypothetical protein